MVPLLDFMSDVEDPKLNEMDKVMALSKADTIKDKIDDFLERIENVDTDDGIEEALTTTKTILDNFQEIYEEEWGIETQTEVGDHFEDDEE